MDRGEHARRAVQVADTGGRVARPTLIEDSRDDGGARREGGAEPATAVDLLCANCGLPIAWSPVVLEGKCYCCGGCALGGPCYCSYDRPE